MSFPSDGRNHREGIKNEHALVATLNTGLTARIWPHVSDTVIAEHRGGTTQKADAVLVDTNTGEVVKYISAKEKKKEHTGTYDYTNSTAYITQAIQNNSPIFVTLRDFINESKVLRASGNITTDKKTKCRTQCKMVVEQTLNSLTNREIRQIITDLLITPNIHMEYIITVLNTKKMYHFPFHTHKINTLLNNPEAIFYLEKKSSKEYCESRTIMVTVGNTTIDTGIRMRLHLNNGISALLGVSKTNNTSSFCIKFQQDNFEDIMEIATLYA